MKNKTEVEISYTKYMKDTGLLQREEAQDGRTLRMDILCADPT